MQTRPSKPSLLLWLLKPRCCVTAKLTRLTLLDSFQVSLLSVLIALSDCVCHCFLSLSFKIAFSVLLYPGSNSTREQ